MKIKVFLLTIICLFPILDVAAQQVSLVHSFKQLRYTLKTDGSNKKTALKQLENLNLIPIYTTLEDENANLKDEISLLDGETSSLSIDIKNER